MAVSSSRLADAMGDDDGDERGEGLDGQAAADHGPAQQAQPSSSVVGEHQRDGEQHRRADQAHDGQGVDHRLEIEDTAVLHMGGQHAQALGQTAGRTVWPFPALVGSWRLAVMAVTDSDRSSEGCWSWPARMAWWVR